MLPAEILMVKRSDVDDSGYLSCPFRPSLSKDGSEVSSLFPGSHE